MKIDRITEAFQFLYPTSWRTMFSKEVALDRQKILWEKLLEDFTDSDLVIVLSYLVKKTPIKYITFPPMPLEFAALANEIKKLSLPGVEEAFRDAASPGKILSPFVQEVANLVDRYALTTQPVIVMRKRFETAYNEVIGKYIQSRTFDSLQQEKAVVGAYTQSDGLLTYERKSSTEHVKPEKDYSEKDEQDEKPCKIYETIDHMEVPPDVRYMCHDVQKQQLELNRLRIKLIYPPWKSNKASGDAQTEKTLDDKPPVPHAPGSPEWAAILEKVKMRMKRGSPVFGSSP